MRIPAAALQNVLSARGMNVATLAARVGLSREVLERAVRGSVELDDDTILSLADELAVPIGVLFAHRQLPLFTPVDFRTTNLSVGEFSKGTLQAINFVERISTTFAALDVNLELDASVRQIHSSNFTLSEAKALAAKWRGYWGVADAEHLDWQDSNKIYTNLREFIENLGVLVVHRQFKTDEAAGLYLHVDNGPHVIVINTTGSSKARKLFTLAHEFGHVLLRAEGASNPSVVRNRVERFCNHFAACLLAPERLIADALRRFGYTPLADDDWIRIFAKKIGLSQEATYLRLVDIGYLKWSDYARWKAKFSNSNHVPSVDRSDGRSGGNSDPLRNKQTQYGSALLNLLGRARNAGQLDEIEIYRLVGLKPNYQNKLFGAA